MEVARRLFARAESPGPVAAVDADAAEERGARGARRDERLMIILPALAWGCGCDDSSVHARLSRVLTFM